MGVLTRQQARHVCNTYMRFARKAHEQWEMKQSVFWENQAARLARAHGLTLRTFTLAGLHVSTEYV